MKIEEAIDYLNTLTGYTFPNPSYRNKALYLGIEALKRLKADREAIPSDKFYRLPGETTD